MFWSLHFLKAARTWFTTPRTVRYPISPCYRPFRGRLPLTPQRRARIVRTFVHAQAQHALARAAACDASDGASDRGAFFLAHTVAGRQASAAVLVDHVDQAGSIARGVRTRHPAWRVGVTLTPLLGNALNPTPLPQEGMALRARLPAPGVDALTTTSTTSTTSTNAPHQRTAIPTPKHSVPMPVPVDASNQAPDSVTRHRWTRQEEVAHLEHLLGKPTTDEQAEHRTRARLQGRHDPPA